MLRHDAPVAHCLAYLSCFPSCSGFHMPGRWHSAGTTQEFGRSEWGGFLQNLVQPLENQEAVGETVFRILPRSVGVHYGIPVSIQACTKPDLIICLRLELVYQLRPELPGSRPPDLLLIEHVCEQLGEWCTCPCLILGQPRSR